MPFKSYEPSSGALPPTQVFPAYFGIGSLDVIPINNDPLNPSFFTGATIVDARDFTLVDAATATVRNDSGRTIKSMVGTINFFPDRTSGFSGSLHLVSERSNDDGTTWILNENSLRIFEFSTLDESFATKVSYVTNLEPGALLRFRIYIVAGGAVQLAPSSDTIMGQTVQGPSYVWELKENL